MRTAVCTILLAAGCRDASFTGPDAFGSSALAVGVSVHASPPEGLDLVRRDEDSLSWIAEVLSTGAAPLVIVGYWSPTDSIPARCARAAATGASIEFWNEPNLEEFWSYNAETGISWPRRRPDARAWVELLRQCREAAPGAVIMGPALGGSRWDWDYLRQATAAGMMEYVDVVTVHGYATEPQDLAQDIDRVRAITGADRVGISEWGIPSDDSQPRRVRDVLRSASVARLEFMIFFHARENALSEETLDVLREWANR
jgi:hypothetical protein